MDLQKLRKILVNEPLTYDTAKADPSKGLMRKILDQVLKNIEVKMRAENHGLILGTPGKELEKTDVMKQAIVDMGMMVETCLGNDSAGRQELVSHFAIHELQNNTPAGKPFYPQVTRFDTPQNMGTVGEFERGFDPRVMQKNLLNLFQGDIKVGEESFEKVIVSEHEYCDNVSGKWEPITEFHQDGKRIGTGTYNSDISSMSYCVGDQVATDYKFTQMPLELSREEIEKALHKVAEKEFVEPEPVEQKQEQQLALPEPKKVFKFPNLRYIFTDYNPKNVSKKTLTDSIQKLLGPNEYVWDVTYIKDDGYLRDLPQSPYGLLIVTYAKQLDSKFVLDLKVIEYHKDGKLNDYLPMTPIPHISGLLNAKKPKSEFNIGSDPLVGFCVLENDKDLGSSFAVTKGSYRNYFWLIEKEIPLDGDILRAVRSGKSEILHTDTIVKNFSAEKIAQHSANNKLLKYTISISEKLRTK